MKVHHVFANRSNIGDWLAARGIQALLREVAPGIEFEEHLCDEPFVAATLARLNTAPADELILVGGGGLFMDYFAPLWEGIAGLGGERPLAIWGVGYVDHKAQPSRPHAGLLRQVVAASALTVVRDELSRELLDLDLPAPVPCPSLMTVDRVELGHGLLHVNNYTSVGAEAYDAMRIAGVARAAATGRQYRETNNRIEPGRENELRAVLERYRLSDVVISSALHGCILAVAMGRPVLAVSGDRKIEAFMDAMGLGAWVLGQDQLGRVPSMLAELDRQGPTGERVGRAIESNRQVARQVAALAARVAAGHPRAVA